jgi:hypothetical protein
LALALNAPALSHFATIGSVQAVVAGSSSSFCNAWVVSAFIVSVAPSAFAIARTMLVFDAAASGPAVAAATSRRAA